MSKTHDRAAGGLYLRAWRDAAGVTQERLGEMAGLSHGAISQLERGLIMYTQPSLERLAAALNCKPADLISGPPETREQREAIARTRAIAQQLLGISEPRRLAILDQIRDAERLEQLERLEGLEPGERETGG